MDIIDILIAKKKSFTGETETLVKQAQAAMAQANEVAAILEDAQEANAAAQAANEAAEAANARSEEIVEGYEALQENFNAAATDIVNDLMDEKVTDITTNLDNYIAENNTTVVVESANTSAAKIKQAKVTKNGTTAIYEVEKNYTSSGDNEDGSMTQKAIKEFLNTLKQELEIKIANNTGTGSGGVSNLGSENAGYLVKIDEDGNIAKSDLLESDVLNTLVNSGNYTSGELVGIEIDYVNNTFTRLYNAAGLQSGSDFDQFEMFGGRRRCNVADNGNINAWYGDAAYKEDGSNGQVMVYQPAFYYKRNILESSNNTVGKVVKKEQLILSNQPLPGFKLHPIFSHQNDWKYLNGARYILISAYEGSIYDVSASEYFTTDKAGIDFSHDKLSSVANAKPISGLNNELTMINAERLAYHRSASWHVTNLELESMNQMLLMVEFGILNGQEALGSGVVNIPKTAGANCASLTGSTAILGNASGVATSTINETAGVLTTYTDEDKVAISYRGMENPWGNLWRLIGGLNLYGNGSLKGGVPYIQNHLNINSYAEDNIDNYDSTGVCVPSSYNWISAMTYSEDTNYDWVYMPAECSTGANSMYPVGDFIWTVANLNNINEVAIGGAWAFGQQAGPFCYGMDKEQGYASRTFGARLMYIPYIQPD